MSVKRDTEQTRQMPKEGGEMPQGAPREKKRRWGTVDTLIVLALVLALAGVIARGLMERQEEDAATWDGPYDVYFVVEEIHTAVLAEVGSFDVLYDNDTGELVGYIGIYNDGTPAIHSTGVLPITGGDWVSASGCFVCLQGSMLDGGLLPAGNEKYFSPGSVLTLRTERALLTVEITDIVPRE